MNKLRKPLVAANWKMNGTQQQVKQFVADLQTVQSTADIVFAPPFSYINTSCNSNKAKTISIAGQNVAQYDKGAYTGEVSAAMLADLGCSHVIIGHSERRILFKETNEIVFSKVKLAFDNNLIPILCVGEIESDYILGKTNDILNKQLDLVLNSLELDLLEKIIIAYEPVWAIGTGKIPQLDEIEQIHQNIRFMFAKKNDRIADSLRIVYGGSLNPANAESVFACANVDGGLVGGASLDFHTFKQIIKALE